MLPKIINTANAAVNWPDPFAKKSLTVVFGDLIRYALGFVGVAALLMFALAGFKWMMSQGDAGKIKEAKTIMVWSALGLILLVMGYAIVYGAVALFGTATQ